MAIGTLGGRQKQTQREKAMRMFRKRQIKLLLTTDVAARGIDIPKLPAVINFDLPTETNTYIHRVGRTGRQGEPGLVINLGDDHDIRDLKKILAPTDYHLEHLYIDNDQITDQKPQKGQNQFRFGGKIVGNYNKNSGVTAQMLKRLFITLLASQQSERKSLIRKTGRIREFVLNTVVRVACD